MPRLPRRGRINSRYAENIVKQTLPRRQTRQYPRQLDKFETQSPSRRVPHYEDDPYWTGNRGEESHGETQRSSNYQPYSENHNEPRVIPNPRGRWFPRRNKQPAAGGRGKRIRKPEPPLLMCGIPRLDRSFVMAKTSSDTQNEETAITETNTSENATVSIDTQQPPFVPDKMKDQGDQKATDSSNHSAEERQIPEQIKYDAVSNSDTEEDFQQTKPAESEAVSLSNQNINRNDSDAGPTQSIVPPKSIVPPPEPLLLPDTAELEKETKKYYEELLGVKDPVTITDKADATVPEEASMSASQVANITKKYDSSEVEKEKEEAQQEEIQTKWSILHQYWEFVRENPYDFNGWTYLLTHVENMDNLEAARSAFEGFLPLYPYCFAYWKRLSDMEMKHNETERSLGILLIGTQCIPLCTDLWMPFLINFIAYAKQKQLPPSCVRELYEYGLQTIGRSWQSSCFWEGCINYELDNENMVGVMALYKRLLATPTKLYNKHWDHFVAIVRDHHPRSLLSIEDFEALRKQTCEELKIRYTPLRHTVSKSIKKVPQPEDKLSTCMKEKLVASYIKTHESNEEQVDKRWKFEERIKRPYFHIKSLDKKQMKNWKDYLDFELSEGDPVRIILLFERCLVSCALYEEFWCQYCSYMENHVQNIIDGKYKDFCEDEIPNVGNSEQEKANENTEKSVSDKEVSEVSTSENIAPGSVNDGQVNSENIVGIKNVESTEDSVMLWGSAKETLSDSVTKSSEENNSIVLNSKSDTTTGEQNQNSNCETLKTSSVDAGVNDGQGVVVKSEPPTLEQIKTELCANLSVEERVLKCPPLTPKWIMTGVSWEDVRQIYRRGAWIHCPSKPSLLMQWAEFEEIQGNMDTARELLTTVIAKYPTLLKGRMQLIELERRAGCYERVKELYGEASRALTLPRQRSWLAIKYARFLFKVVLEADQALAILRKALKKDRGYVHLYHHVFDICYQRQPLDCRGVLASVLLALTSKELPVEDKYWFAYKRVQFLREHGGIIELRAAVREQEELKEKAGLNPVKESKTSNTKKTAKEEDKKEEEKKPETEANDDEKDKKEDTAPNASTVTEVITSTPPDPDATFTVPTSVPQPTQLFPVPYFSADGAITYSPMEGYGYGHANPSQNLPTAQEVVQGTTPADVEPNKKNYHSVPPSWELNIQLGSYGYGNSHDHRWHQESGHHDYDSLITKGYPKHIKDHEVEDLNLPMPLKIDHLRQKPNTSNADEPTLPDLSQPPPGHNSALSKLDNSPSGQMSRVLLPQPPGNQASNRVLLPTPPGSLNSNKVLLPTPPGLPVHLTRPPPPLLGVGPPGLHPPTFGPPGSFPGTNPPGEEHHRSFFDDSQQSFGKRQHPGDYRSEGEPPFKMQNTNFDDSQQYRAEYDNNYTSSPGPSAPPSHRANFGSYEADYDMYGHSRRENEHPTDQYNEERESYNVENSRLNEPKRYSLRDDSYDSSIPREMSRSETETLCVNVPDWLVKEGGELRLSDTSNGVSLIRYWPNFMTSQGHTVLFRALRKGLKWYQRLALLEGQWQNLPHLLSWIGPCDYSFSGVSLEKNTDWLPEIVDLLHRLIRYTGNKYNCCYLALHRNGYDNTTWASENHLALRKNPSIASVSVGATRVFEMRRKNGSGYLRFPVFPGSLLVMEGATQEDWTHQFPKQPNVPGERIHLIFRKFYMIEGLTV